VRIDCASTDMADYNTWFTLLDQRSLATGNATAAARTAVQSVSVKPGTKGVDWDSMDSPATDGSRALLGEAGAGGKLVNHNQTYFPIVVDLDDARADITIPLPP